MIIFPKPDMNPPMVSGKRMNNDELEDDEDTFDGSESTIGTDDDIDVEADEVAPIDDDAYATE
jgi:hypothetical protein